MKNKRILIVAIFISVIGILGLTKNTYAADSGNIMKKWIFTQYYSCIRDSYINDTITQKNNGPVANDVFKNSVDFFLPSYNFENTVSNGAIKCKELFLGGVNGLSQGVLDYAGGDGKTVDWSRPGAAASFLEGLGYGQVDRSRDQKFIIIANDHQKYHQVRGFISDDGEKDLEAQSAIIKAEVNNDGATTYSIEGTYVDFYSTISVEIKNHQLHLWIDTNRFGPYGCSAMYNNQEAFIDLKDNVSQFYNDVKNTLQNKTWGKHCYSSSSSGMMVNVDETWDTYTFDVNGSGIVDSATASDFVYAEGGNRYDVSNTAVKNMSGMSISDLILSNSELYTLYYYYLDKALPAGTQNRITCDPGSTINLTPVNLKDQDGNIKTCYVNFNGTDPNSIRVYTQDHTDLRYRQPYPYIKSITMQDVIDWLNLVDPSTLTDIDSINPSSENGGNSEEDPCYNAGVEGMSWILCPTIDNTANAVDGIESVLRGWLQIDTNQIFRSQTYDAWNVFRNIANALIIIVLLVIIFSQLTGVGIDNYGIKKMLPRLVIMAILINLSYIVCELAVDLSNILGVGLNNMFESIGTAIRGGSGAAVETVATIVDALLATLAGAGAVAGTVITIVGIAEGGGVMLIISLVLVLLVALVAVLMFFVMLGSRMVIVIMFTVIAPVAFACYILPNTQGLFKKWWKVFQAALVIFPICGALYGMSFVIKAIIFGGGDVDFIMALIAVCVPFLPFLLLPTLLRSALAGLGALGGTLTMMGNGLRRGLSSGNAAIRNTDRYKSALERNAENRTRFRAGINRQGKEIEMGRFGRFVRGGDRGVARARMQYVKDQNKQALERKMFGDDDIGFAAALTSQQKAADADMVKDYMTYINSETNNGEKIHTYEDGRQETELGRMLRSYASSGNKFGAVAAARIAGRRKDTASDFLKNYFGDTSEYSSEMREALAREIATGENSANYRESSPFGFEFAAQINKGSKNEDESPITDYASWLGHQDASGSYDNVHRAMNNYVTNSKDLVGMKGGALKELAKLMREGGIDASDAERLRGVARDAIRNRGTTGVWDSTKEQQIYEIAGLPYPPVDASAGRRTGGSGGRSSGDIPDGYT